MTARAPLPAVTTPEDLAAHLGVSERTLREMARALGACRMFGLAMMLWDFALGTVIAMPGFLCLLAIARPTASTSQEQEP